MPRMTMTVLVNAGPWLSVPPPGYGGIENVLAALVPELRKRGVRVVLATVGSSTLPVDDRVAVFPDGRFADLQRPYNRVMGVAAAHLHRVVRELRRRDDVVLVHDHQEAFGLTVLEALGRSCPPVLHTLHWDLRKHPELYGNVDGGGSLWVNGVSFAQLTTAPAALRALSVGHVHLSTPLAVDADRRPAVTQARAPGRDGPRDALQGPSRRGAAGCTVRGWRWCLRVPWGRTTARRSSPGTDVDEDNPDVRYWREEVEPLVDGRRVRWVGTVAGQERDDLVATARASLVPIDWEEPGGTAVVESLALGTPVVGFRRGCLPELVEHGRTGLLVDPGDEDGLAVAAAEATRLNPDDCRREAARRFTPSRMAERYLRLYDKVLVRSGRPRVHEAVRNGASGA